MVSLQCILSNFFLKKLTKKIIYGLEVRDTLPKCLLSLAVILCSISTHGPFTHALDLPQSDVKKFDQCQFCHIIARDFQTGFDATKRDNYGGGNTHWEESRLGSYANSEMRLMQIMEKLCQKESDNKKTKCHGFVEDLEESLERWWLKQWAPLQKTLSTAEKDNVESVLYTDLCVNQLTLCCPRGHFGAQCTPCDGWNATSQHICSARGTCHGNETRVGTGQCECDTKYKGRQCEECNVGYYAAQALNADHNVECNACHASCGSEGCTGPDATHCISCAAGWVLAPADGVEPQGCLDVDECNSSPLLSSQKDGEAGQSPCASQADTYCENTVGNYSCQPCHESCAVGSGCLGPDANHCRACRSPGYSWDPHENRCEDVDECAAENHVCHVDGQVCTNVPGSYTCACPDGEEQDNQLNKCLPRTESTTAETPSEFDPPSENGAINNTLDPLERNDDEEEKDEL